MEHTDGDATGQAGRAGDEVGPSRLDPVSAGGQKVSHFMDAKNEEEREGEGYSKQEHARMMQQVDELLEESNIIEPGIEENPGQQGGQNGYGQKDDVPPPERFPNLRRRPCETAQRLFEKAA
jgi:hypothetical protein